MDCGPASLKALLDGYGISVGYEQLREACQTDVDGSSIDTMEDLARQLGLDADQVMTPVDHLLLPTNPLPAIVVVRLPNGFTHFVLLWRTHGPVVQLMDPATGRRWSTQGKFVEDLYIHEMPVPADAWRTYAGCSEFLDGLRFLMKKIGVGKDMAEEMIKRGLADAGWQTCAALDASIRMVGSIVRSGGISRGRVAARLLRDLFDGTLRDGVASSPLIPADYWSARSAPVDDEGNEQVQLRGAVLVRINGVRLPKESEAPTAQLPPDLVRALDEPPSHPARRILQVLRQDGLLTPLVLLASLSVAASGVVLEALLFRGLFDLGFGLSLPEQRLIAIGALIAIASIFLMVDLPVSQGLLRMGRRLEIRLRLAFMKKIPLLGDRYFQSRPISDMAERSHSIQGIRALPGFGGQLLRTVFQFILTIAGIIWLDPAGALLVLVGGGVILAVPLLFNPVLSERDLKARTHVGALGRFYLDALLGLAPIRTHGAERNVRREHESLLVEWARSSFRLQRGATLMEGLQSLAGLGFAAWLLFDHVSRVGINGGILLLAWWGLQLPTLGQTIGLLARQYPSMKNLALRLLEPIGMKTDQVSPQQSEIDAAKIGNGNPAVSIVLEGVAIVAAGHSILDDVHLRVEPGSHIAIVGHSGSGKSSFAGILLGWHRPASGTVLIDNAPLDDERLARLRHETAWVEPAIQLWNRPFIENLVYGNDDAPTDLPRAIGAADLRGLLERLPHGLGTSLGENGGLVSGGEGQRIRFARALLRPGIRLVIFDEPFRGLDRERRRTLLRNARELWRDATFLCITHDIGETLAFPRVVVFDHGRIVEDDAPGALAERDGSHYRSLLEADVAVREGVWSSSAWRRLRVESGRIVERDDREGKA